ncbi:hypothetical protein [Nocardioides lijunqiniae]|uniref:hypothetical protein n=1 Tax=Nocardioides lijunqiniae TaxID=2760832 RepID=UPI0018776F12|nr:hypothetical protein [Nocardioides lijunqiniae]
MSSRLAVLRAWGAPRTLLTALALAGAVQLAASAYVGLPAFAAEIPALDLAAPAAALLLASPLVDQTPDLTLRAVRPLWRVLLLRYALVQACGAVVLVSLTLTAWTLSRALVLVVFLAGSAVAVAAVEAWFWVPVLAASYAWLWRAQQRGAAEDDVALTSALATLVLGGLVFVAAGTWRAHRARCPPR